MKMEGTDVYNVLVNNGVDTLHHANSVVTSCTFLHLKGLASRAYVDENGLPQTDQYTDEKDKYFGIWNDIFTDGVNIHYRGGKARGANLYGPVLFKLPVTVLLDLPEGSEVMVTRENPANWNYGGSVTDYYFGSPEELQAGYRYGDFKQHIVIRTPTGVLPFSEEPVRIDLDNPQRSLPDGSDAYETALMTLEAAAEEAGITIDVTPHECQWGCRCITNYASSPVFTKMFSGEF
jgi:hypothetical protein